jgi:2-isopropylmalate synthase
LKLIGFEPTRDELDVVYANFLIVADEKKEILDADLQELATINHRMAV